MAQSATVPGDCRETGALPTHPASRSASTAQALRGGGFAKRPPQPGKERSGVPMRFKRREARPFPCTRNTRGAEGSAKRYLDRVRLQQRLGGVSQLVVVDAQRSYLNAALACVQTEAERLSDTVALYAALAGGWTTTPQ